MIHTSCQSQQHEDPKVGKDCPSSLFADSAIGQSNHVARARPLGSTLGSCSLGTVQYMTSFAQCKLMTYFTVSSTLTDAV